MPASQAQTGFRPIADKVGEFKVTLCLAPQRPAVHVAGTSSAGILEQ
jgi:hypothetical protein